MTRNRPRTIAILATIACSALAGCCAPVRADEALIPAEDRARDLVDGVLREAGGNGLGEWTRSVIERALERAGKAASNTTDGWGPGTEGKPDPAPLPAERHAPALGARGRTGAGEVILFTSLSVPAASWRQSARDAARIGAPLVLRGVAPEGLRATVKAVGVRLGGAQAGVAIDPRLFRLFDVSRVPAVAVVPGGVPACRSRGCSDDAPPPFDVVAGNIRLAAALEAIAAEGGAGRDVAKRHLARLEGGAR